MRALILLIALFQYEIPSNQGLTKICVYESYKGQHTIVIDAYKICPMQLRVDG